MQCLGKKLFFLTFLVLISAVVAISFLLTSRKTPRSQQIKEIQELPPFRSLFEPNEEEIRAFKREERTRANDLEEQKRADLLKEKRAKAFEFQKLWKNEPNRKNTLELVNLASQNESGKLFSEISENVLRFWKENRIENLSASDLAD